MTEADERDLAIWQENRHLTPQERIELMVAEYFNSDKAKFEVAQKAVSEIMRASA
jgi:hypothetical protein